MALDAHAAAAHLAQRDAATAKLRALSDRYGANMPAGARDTERRLLAEIARLDGAVSDAVGAAAADERAARADERAVRTELAVIGARSFADAGERRSREQVRVLGVPIRLSADTMAYTERSADALDALDTGNLVAAPVMLAEVPAGSQLLDKVQQFTFRSQRGYVPLVPALEGRVLGRNEELMPNELTHGTVEWYETVKVAAMVRADFDQITDYPQYEAATDAALLSALGRAVDAVLINGGDDGDVQVPGMLEAGVTTSGAVDGPSVLGALARCKVAGAVPDALIMHPLTEAELIDTISDAVAAKLPEIIALPAVAEGTIVAASLANVAVAMRENLDVGSSTQHPELFAKDQVALSGRARVGGVVLANPAHVQVVTAAGAA
ncbi:hypothetical protein ACIQZN_15580 [Streptomyces sp. NPDC097595]|uniref:hypothetical protein n=1 Tax=Streptomyces sp. NPDC097595 TaxID=3366090 RepID=UPI0038088F26